MKTQEPGQAEAFAGAGGLGLPCHGEQITQRFLCLEPQERSRGCSTRAAFFPPAGSAEAMQLPLLKSKLILLESF